MPYPIFKESENVLRNEMQTGRFIVRESSSNTGELTLSVLVGDEVRHIRVCKLQQGGISLRANPTQREIFNNMNELVDCFSHTKLQLRDSIPFYLIPTPVTEQSDA